MPTPTDHGTPVTTGRCADCPAPPDGAVEWLASAADLATVPLAGLVVGLAVVFLARRRVGPPGRTYLVVGLVPGVGLFLGGVATGNSTLATVGLVLGAAVGLTVAAGRLASADAGPGIADRIGVWLGLALLGNAILLAVGGSVVGMMAGLVLLGVMAYPFGLAVGQRDHERRLLGVGGVVLAMAGTVVVAVGQLLPFPGGPAYLLVYAFAGLITVTLVVATPLVALGEARASPGGKSIHPER